MSNRKNPESGFTLLEVLVVAVMVGILSAIAAPGWVSFTNRQRVNAAANTMVDAINQGKSKAKKDKLPQTIQFRMNGTVPEYAVYTTGDTPFWQQLSSYSLTVTAIALNFDSKGTPTGATATALPATVTVANGNIKRCTSITTLLGSTTQGSDSGCP